VSRGNARWAGADDRTALDLTLPDGGRARFRPLVPDDAQSLERGFELLSQQSRYMRFLRDKPELSGPEIAAFTTPDGTEHEAIGVALLDADGGERPAGVARYYRTRDAQAAEFALTVIDHAQSRRLGALLLGFIAGVARDRGIARFLALVHRDNHVMRHILSDLGAVTGSRLGDDVEIVLPLQQDVADYPATPSGDAMRMAQNARQRRDVP